MGWSNMLPEVLDVIARKHIVFYEDYHSFAGVCKSWHTVALKAAKEVAKGNGPPSRLPSLMLSEEVEDKKYREIYLLSNKTIREIRLPEVYGKLCMSSCGWLLTVADDHYHNSSIHYHVKSSSFQRLTPFLHQILKYGMRASRSYFS